MRYILSVFFVFVLSGAVLAQTTVPYTFTAGTAAQASQVNANFQALAAAIDSGIPGYEIIQQQYSLPVISSTGGSAPLLTATCSPGKSVLGGGYGMTSGNNLPSVIQMQSIPNVINGTYSWIAQLANNSGGTVTVNVYAICAVAHQ